MNNRKLDKCCPVCNKGITDQAIHCNKCKHRTDKSSLPRKRRLDNHCLDCGKEIDDRATHCSSCSKTGERHPRYRGGLVQIKGEHRRDRIVGYIEWMKSVFARDDWKCQHCDSNAKLRAHHIYSYAKYPELRLNMANGITLCEFHHQQLHQLFGLNVTPEQLKWYFANVK